MGGDSMNDKKVIQRVLEILWICYKFDYYDVKVNQLDYLARETLSLGIDKEQLEEYIEKRFICRDSDFKIEKRKFQVAVIEI